jgi:hypothetical protein
VAEIEVMLDGKAQQQVAADLRAAQGARAPAPVPPFEPFPLHALPKPLREYVEQAARALGVEPSFVALPVLAVAAALIGNARSIQLKRGFTEPAILWAAIVGDSGTLKSPALAVATGPMYRLQRYLDKKFQKEFAKYENEDKPNYESRKAEAKKKGEPFDEKPPEKPVEERVVGGDLTIEKVAELLEDNPKGILVARDELGSWLGSFTRYKSKGAGSDLPNWLEISRGGTLQYDRKTGDRRRVFVRHASASVCGGIQPGTLARALDAAAFEAGLPARFLMAMPPKRRKVWTEMEISEEAEDAFARLLEQLQALTMMPDRDGEKRPFVLFLSPEAKATWERFYGEWADVQFHADGDRAASLAKLEGYTARLALIHHVVSRVADGTDKEPVGAESMEAAAELVRWFADESQRIYAVLHESEDARATRRLAELIASWGGKATAREVHKSNRSRYPTADDAEKALDLLVQDGLAEWQNTAPGDRGGRRTRLCVLTPTPKPPETRADGDEPENGKDPETPGVVANSGGKEGIGGFRGRGSRSSGPALPPPSEDGGQGVSGHRTEEDELSTPFDEERGAA